MSEKKKGAKKRVENIDNKPRRKKRSSSGMHKEFDKKNNGATQPRERHLKENHGQQQNRKSSATKKVRESNSNSNRKNQKVHANVKVEKASNKIARVAFNLIFYVVTISILLGVGLSFISKDSNKSFLGYRVYTVLTNSMVPKDPEKQKGGFAAGDVIIVQMVDPKSLEKGDIITYNLLTTTKTDTVLTHRIVDFAKDEKGKKVIITQGDANSGPDRPVNFSQVIGKKVFAIPKVGTILSFVKKNWLISLGILVALFSLIISLRYYFSLPDSEAPM